MLLKFVLGQEPHIVKHILNAFHTVFIGHGKQFVDGHTEDDGQIGQHQNIGHIGAAFPFAYGLGGHTQLLCQLLLGHGAA